MNRFFLSLILSFFVSLAFSQRVYFVYLQNESSQPFYVKLNGKTIHSGKDGYLVVPKLVDSTYEFSIGSTDNKLTEQKFAIKIDAQDHGYLLKGLEDKSWGLFDLQSLAVIHPSSAIAASPETRQVSAFTDVLSRAANDPSLKEKPIELVKEEKSVAVVPVVKEEKPVPVEPVIVQQEVKKDTIAATPPVVVNTPEVKQELPVIVQENNPVKEKVLPVVEEAYQRSNVVRRSESSTTEGLGLTFIDEYSNGNKDTIRIVIPNSSVALPQQVTAPVTPVAEQKKADPRFLNIESDPAVASSSSYALRKNDCSAVATESDFLKLRKKMAGEIKADAMLAEARKGFKAKCYTVAQVKNLGTLFLEEDGRYRFFDEAFMHVSDKENFSSLVSELKQEYYINRFNAMLK